MMTGKIRLVKRIKGIQSLVEEICKITQSKLNCHRLQYELHFIVCSCKIESSERKKIARKHSYSLFEYCEMEPLKKKHLVKRRKVWWPSIITKKMARFVLRF